MQIRSDRGGGEGGSVHCCAPEKNKLSYVNPVTLTQLVIFRIINVVILNVVILFGKITKLVFSRKNPVISKTLFCQPEAAFSCVFDLPHLVFMLLVVFE